MDNITWLEENLIEFTLTEDIYIRYNINTKVWFAHHMDEEMFDDEEIIEDFEGDLELFNGTFVLTEEDFDEMKEIVESEK